jgi:hypothetical protein
MNTPKKRRPPPATADDQAQISARNAADQLPSSPILRKFIAALGAAAAAPILYLNGSAYHEGYLNGLGLLPSMFSIDTASTFTTGVLAWYMALASGISWLTSFINESVWYIVIFFVFASLTIGTWIYCVKRSDSKTIQIERTTKSSRADTWLSKVGKSAFLLCVSGYSLLMLATALILLISVLVLPFLYVGRSVAKEDLTNHFADSPVVDILNGTVPSTQYKIITCSTSFCALYSKGTIATVPLSAIQFATSHPMESSANK